ncbi:MAG TPA: PLP-dependent aminotransferase family protein [Cellvibrionaceae bacterium]
MYKYQLLDEQLSHEINSGQFKAGDKLPSLRQFSQRHNVSLNTANRIYEQLQARGLIESRPQSGYFVCSIHKSNAVQSPPGQAVLVNKDKSDLLMSIQRSALSKDVINFGAGVLGSAFLPLTELNRAAKRAQRRHPEILATYGDPAGELPLREAIARHLQSRITPAPTAEHIVITNGCLEGVCLAIQTLTRPGEVVAIFTPCYNGLLMMLQQLGRQVLEIPCAATGPDLDYLEALLRERAFSCLVFSAIAFNPSGFCLSASEKQRLAALAKRYRTAFIEDDAFGELAYRGVENSPVYTYDHAGFITYCSSFSKSLSPGFRVGWLICETHTQSYIKNKMAINLSCNLSAQYTLADYLNSDNYSAHINRLSRQLQSNIARAEQVISKHFPANTHISRPDGGFFLWLQLAQTTDTLALYNHAAKQRIIIAPGELFSLAGLYRHCLRLSLAGPWLDTTEAALKRLGRWAAGKDL